jgi:alpha-mannosidase
MAYLHGRPYASDQYEQWGRALLQNSVHDCICGVSIDQVHEKMEYSYKQVFEEMGADTSASLTAMFNNFASGTYAVSTNPFAQDAWTNVDDALIHIQTNGVGIWPVTERVAVVKTNTETDHFAWTNDHYEAEVTADGLVAVGDGVYGELVVSAEHGDTYSDEIGERLGRMQASSRLMLEETSDHQAVLSFTSRWQGNDVEVSADIRLIFDDSPLIKWEIDLDSRGKDFRVEMVFDTAVPGVINAGMPHDNVTRPVADTDLLPHDLPAELSPVLLGQRELNSVSMFPFHDYVSVQDAETAVTVLAKGLRGYRAEAGGILILPLRRAVEWLTAAELKDRMGDAGPFFYVPDARCERAVKHELAVAVGLDGVDSIPFQAVNAAYQNPPIIVDVEGNGARSGFRLLQENVPLSALFVQNGQPTARFYNPGPQERPFSETYTAVDVYGKQIDETDSIGPKKILSLNLDVELAGTKEAPDERATVINTTLPQWRVGENQGRPDESIMARLAADVAVMNGEIAELEGKLTAAEGAEKLLIQHRIYVLQRESLEFQLSHLLNERKLEQNGALNWDYLYEPDAEIAELGLALNKLRIKRRIYDYVVEAVK